MRVLQGGGKLRRITAGQRRVSDQRTAELVEEAGRLEYNDALLVIGRRLRMPVDDVIHEWNLLTDSKNGADARENARQPVPPRVCSRRCDGMGSLAPARGR